MYFGLKKALVLLSLAAALPAWGSPITAVLKLKEKVSMEQLAHNVQDPRSDHYQKFYEPAEIRALAAPSDQEYQELLQGLKEEGFTVVSESTTHLWVSVRAETKIFESVFATQIQSFGPKLHQRVAKVMVPYHLSLIESVGGLSNTRKAFPKLMKTMDAPEGSPGGVPQATIKTAYGFAPLYASGLTGKGQHIAIATYDGFHADMVRKFYTLSALKPMPTVDQVDFNGTAAFSENSAIETELDAEFSGMIAPGASVHVFPSATNDDTGELQMFTAILDDNRAKIVNYSWGSCETGLDPKHTADMEKVFARAVAQGVNIMVASGDSGSDSCADGTKVADWPAANDNIVAVGGTTFSQNAGKISESGWSGSGGGISAIWALPSYQAHLGGIFTMRSYPDVSFNADPASGQAVWTEMNGKAGWLTVGGTSMAAPQWSGFLALVGEAREKSGKGPIGYLNPIIYGNNLGNSFHDVTTGNNGAYQATAGWDAVTGFGSMQADVFLNALKAF